MNKLFFIFLALCNHHITVNSATTTLAQTESPQVKDAFQTAKKLIAQYRPQASTEEKNRLQQFVSDSFDYEYFAHSDQLKANKLKNAARVLSPASIKLHDDIKKLGDRFVIEPVADPRRPGKNLQLRKLSDDGKTFYKKVFDELKK